MCMPVGLQVPMHVQRSEEGIGSLVIGVRGLKKAQWLREPGPGRNK